MSALEPELAYEAELAAMRREEAAKERAGLLARIADLEAALARLRCRRLSETRELLPAPPDGYHWVFRQERVPEASVTDSARDSWNDYVRTEDCPLVAMVKGDAAIAELEATIERLTWMLEQALAKDGWDTLEDLERRRAERDQE